MCPDRPPPSSVTSCPPKQMAVQVFPSWKMLTMPLPARGEEREEVGGHRAGEEDNCLSPTFLVLLSLPAKALMKTFRVSVALGGPEVLPLLLTLRKEHHGQLPQPPHSPQLTKTTFPLSLRKDWCKSPLVNPLLPVLWSPERT